MPHVVSEYLHNVLTPGRLTQTVNRVIRLIARSKVKFDAIAFRGMSGALIAPQVASHFSVPLLMIRKNKNNSHSRLTIEGKAVKKYIIVDDCISSGKTMEIIVDAVRRFGEYNGGWSKDDIKCQGIFLYSPSEGEYKYWYYDIAANDEGIRVYC